MPKGLNDSGGTRAWRATRDWVLAENMRTNDGRCNQRLRGCTVVADTVHHIYGRAVTGDDRRYLQATCRACNLKIGDPSKRKHIAHRSVTNW